MKKNKKPIEYTIEHLFDIQQRFQHHFYLPKKLSMQQKVDLSKEYLLSAHNEISEVLGTLPWKTHRKYEKKEVNYAELKKELVDVIKFLINIMYIWNISAEDFMDAFYAKSIEVEKRYSNEKSHIKHL